MRLVSIASGSSGNAIYIGTERTHVLIDAGISNKRIEEGLARLGIRADELDAVFLTHEHSDHVKGLRVLEKKHSVPLYATGGTIGAVRSAGLLKEVPDELVHKVGADREFRVGDLLIRPFHIDHDAAEPVAYRVTCGKKAAAVATDMGHYTDEIIRNLSGLDALLVEANHDVRMLETGPYPYPLKRRILSDFGHLSNENCGKLICGILHDGMKHILLGHLSKENNYPALAYETVRCEIGSDPCLYGPDDFPIEVAGRDKMSSVIEF